MHCNLSDDQMHNSYIEPCINQKKTRKNDWLVAQSDALQSLAFLVNNSLK